MRTGPPKTMVILGIAGGTGSGKTTLSEAIARELGPDCAQILNQDSYYRNSSDLPMDIRNRVNYDHPSAFDWPLLRKHLKMLRQGRPIERPHYDFRTHSRSRQTRRLDPKPVLIAEGILLFHDPGIRAMMGIKVYVETDPDIRFIRRLNRDMRERGRTFESVVDQYLNTVRPMHLTFVEPTRRHADLIVPEGGQNRVAVTAIIEGIRSCLGSDPPR